MRPKNEQGGELVVVGHDKAYIPLKDLPHRVDVQFRHKKEPPPCDPHHHHPDELEYEVHRNYGDHYHNHHYTLIIKWKVHDVREIIWFASY
jgi:hypothetical protein